jgi:transposase InsO family protein
MHLRHEFVLLAQQEGVNRRELCRRFNISPKTAYKWIARFQQQGQAGLADQPRRPTSSPSQTEPSLEAAVIALRRQHPAWGGRKISSRLATLGHPPLAPSTITAILHRHGLITQTATDAATSWQRFEHAEPNALWQIDFKGYVTTPAGPCHPLTMLDDHSRYNLMLAACSHTHSQAVQALLTTCFQRYGLPVRMNADNGPPWGSPSQPEHGITCLTVWLIRLGIRVSHSRPHHPQTNGKEERFHRSLKAEVLNGRSFDNLQQAQIAFDQWRTVYNQERPHEALAMATPVTRYRPSARAFPAALPAIEYGSDDRVVTPGWNGSLKFERRTLKVSSALKGLPIAFRPLPQQDGCYDVYFCHQRFMHVDLRNLPA